MFGVTLQVPVRSKIRMNAGREHPPTSSDNDAAG